jgi:U3 small nucleolar RNA-associated protein 22
MTSNTNMAPPAIKRRKLEHSDSEEESGESFAGFDETHGDISQGSDAEESADGSDFSMDELEDLKKVDDDGDDDEDDADDDFEEQGAVHESRKQTAAGQTVSAKNPPKRPASSLQDGVYTAETFKSNMFKLQVDELLEQVKPKYGKKEAPAENAMRTLKTIIEQIPRRDPLPVRVSPI